MKLTGAWPLWRPWANTPTPVGQGASGLWLASGWPGNAASGRPNLPPLAAGGFGRVGAEGLGWRKGAAADRRAHGQAWFLGSSWPGRHGKGLIQDQVIYCCHDLKLQIMSW